MPKQYKLKASTVLLRAAKMIAAERPKYKSISGTYPVEMYACNAIKAVLMKITYQEYYSTRYGGVVENFKEVMGYYTLFKPGSTLDSDSWWHDFVHQESKELRILSLLLAYQIAKSEGN